MYDDVCGSAFQPKTLTFNQSDKNIFCCSQTVEFVLKTFLLFYFKLNVSMLIYTLCNYADVYSRNRDYNAFCIVKITNHKQLKQMESWSHVLYTTCYVP